LPETGVSEREVENQMMFCNKEPSLCCRLKSQILPMVNTIVLDGLARLKQNVA
jgi:hypothetical protein